MYRFKRAHSQLIQTRTATVKVRASTRQYSSGYSFGEERKRMSDSLRQTEKGPPQAGQIHLTQACDTYEPSTKDPGRLQNDTSITFTVNGNQYTVGTEYNPATSLNEYLRSSGISPGTKQMCIEGGCGVCLVAVSLLDPVSNTKQVYAVNSCMVQLYMCDGWQITTIEGLGNPTAGLHPIQDRLAKFNGSQCGYCSPAQVMNMYGLLQKNQTPTMQQVEDINDATICRCTGYRPILDAMKSFAVDAPPGLLGGAIDIEDLNPKLCKKTGEPCSGLCSLKDRQKGLEAQDSNMRNSGFPLLSTVGDRAQWFKPTTLADLYKILNQYHNANYRLVFGNTGYGVYKEIGPWMFDILIDIRGIQTLYKFNLGSTVVVGANLSLENLLDIFQRSSAQSSLPYFAGFAKHMGQVAPNTIRSIASWAGSLMLKHAHPDFVSDIYTLLETVNTQLIIGNFDGTEATYSLSDFLTLDMRGKVIISANLPIYTDDNDNYYIHTYRVAQRVQNCHGYVTAGFNLKVDKTKNYMVMEQPRLVFQGISGVLNRATVTEGRLTGLQLGDPKILSDILTILHEELIPTSGPVLASPDFRRNLAVALFYKFVLSVCTDKVAGRFQSGGTVLERPVSSGSQTYDTHKEKWPVNEPMVKVEAAHQTSGVTQFLDDIPMSQKELHAAFVISTQGNARIASMDATAALTMPGVHKFIQASDIPSGGHNSFMPPSHYPIPEELLCSGQVVYAGQPLGIIVADDPQIATTAASMVNVTYSDIQPPILDILTAIENQSFFPNPPDPLVVGNAEEAIAQSARRVTGSIELGTQYHFYLETQISRCVPMDDGGMYVQASTQWIDAASEVVSNVLGIPRSSDYCTLLDHVGVSSNLSENVLLVTLEVARLGGAFGGKVTRNFLVSGACALAAYIMQRPVRMRLDLHTNMKALGKRFPFLANYEVGFTEDGKLNGVKITYYADSGYCINDNAIKLVYGHIDNVYFCQNWKLIPVGVKTNKASNTACRAPGSLPAHFIMESIMEHVAKSLNKNPTDVRQINFFQKGQTTANGMKLDYCNIKDLVSQLEDSSELVTRMQQVASFNQANRWRKRGLSLVPMRFGIGWNGTHFEVSVSIYHCDGTVSIQHGGIEMGQGINTKVTQVCAYELGIDMSLIRVKRSSSVANANSAVSGGSISSELNCMTLMYSVVSNVGRLRQKDKIKMGVIQCCQILKSRMAPVKETMQNPSWQQLVTKSYKAGIELTAHAYTNPHDQYDFHYNVYGATVAEAELDVLTGQSQINRVDMLYDCGESLNPELDIGQVEGGFLMGLGYHLTEKIKYDPDTGVLLTDGTWDYKPPMSKEVPIDFRVGLLKNTLNPVGVLGSKATGEPPVMMSSSVLFAIKHAVEAARGEIGQDVFFPLNSPALVEDVQTACLLDNAQFTFGQ